MIKVHKSQPQTCDGKRHKEMHLHWLLVAVRVPTEGESLGPVKGHPAVMCSSESQRHGEVVEGSAIRQLRSNATESGLAPGAVGRVVRALQVQGRARSVCAGVIPGCFVRWRLSEQRLRLGFIINSQERAKDLAADHLLLMEWLVQVTNECRTHPSGI